MPAGLDRPVALARQQDRQVVVGVGVAVADAAAVDDHAVVEQRAVALGDRLQLLEQVSQLGDVELVDLLDLLLLGRVAAVVREVVVAVRDADGPVAAVAAVVGEDERGDPREVALERQHEQVAHQPQVLLVVGRDAERPRVLRPSHVDRGPAAVDPLLDLAHAGEVLIELAAVGGAERSLELSGVLADEVEDALAVGDRAGPASSPPLPGRARRRADRRPAGD